MKKPIPEKERQLELCDVLTRIELLINGQDKIEKKLNELLRRTAPGKAREQSETVGQHDPQHKQSSHGASLAARGVTNAPAKSIYDMAPRTYQPDTHVVHPDLGTL